MTRGTDIMKHSDLILRPDPARTVLRPFDVGDPPGFDHQAQSRPERIAARVLSLDAETLTAELARVMAGLDQRHRDVEAAVLRRYEDVKVAANCADANPEQARLIGAYFLQEYAFEAAALFNPSMIRRDDQTGAPEGGVRFVMSLRGIGEGHLSSVTFRVGDWCPKRGFHVDPPSEFGVAPRIEEGNDDGSEMVRILFEESETPSETILFPVTKAQQRGIEDMRLVQFVEDDGSVRHLGTYTAFSGSEARCELMEAFDWRRCTMQPMTGEAAQRKGMALFPRRIAGQFAMLGRQDNENLWLLRSDSLTHWEGGERILMPKHFWEFVQIGNCGSPIEIDEGWLVLTHGVGSVRNYCIGAALLDRDDPTKVLGRMALPLVHPSPKERDGYVPNVVYSCGGIVHDRRLLLPYGVADNFTAFADVALDDLLAELRD
jgi:predicted GH43/DUF377 family glycosyl hydrolase